MKRTFSFITIIVCLFMLTSCNGRIVSKISNSKPDVDEIIDVEVEDYGYNAYFTVNDTVKDLTVNTMNYDDLEDKFTLNKNIYKTNKLTKNTCLKIILDLEKEIPYVMVKYTYDNKTYEQYVYMDMQTGKMLLLERE